MFEFSGMTGTIASRMLAMPDDSKSVREALKRLVEQGFIDRTLRKNQYQYWFNNRGADLLFKLDRVPLGSVDGRALRPWRRQELEEHDWEAMIRLSQFAKIGLAVANGLRSWESWGGGALAPDGMVRLLRSPYGPGWHYFEEERSARRRFRAEDKLGNYCSGERRDNWPVMFVLWDDEAERIFKEVGREHRLRLLTTTRQRLAEHGVLGPCWSMYGEIVSLG